MIFIVYQTVQQPYEKYEYNYKYIGQYKIIGTCSNCNLEKFEPPEKQRHYNKIINSFKF